MAHCVHTSQTTDRRDAVA